MAQPSDKQSCTSNDDVRKKIQCYSYRLGDRVGEGYSSVVYRGQHDQTKQAVAVKVVDLKSLKDAISHELLRSEIAVIKKLRHPNLLRCHSVLMTVNNCYIVTEYCSGGDLATLLKRRGRLSEKEAVGYMRDIFNGYLELANRNIIHRDIKPANILLSEGSCRIADFGFAKYDKDPGAKEKYHVGTPLYMSPQALSCNIYSQKNDIWSLGIMFYEILHGSTPWQNCKTQKELLEKMYKQRPEFKVRVTPELQQLILGCLEIQQGKRLDAQLIAQQLTLILQKENCHRRLDLPSKQQQFRNEPLLRSYINLNRAIFKHYPKFESLECDQPQKLVILGFLLNWLKLGVKRLHSFTEDRVAAEEFGLHGYDHYTTTSEWRRVSQVIREYHQRYTAFVEERLSQMSVQVDSFQCLNEVWLPQFGVCIGQLPIQPDNPQQLIAVDYLLSLLQLARLLRDYPLSAVSDHLQLDVLVQAHPTPLGPAETAELLRKRETILTGGV